MKKIIGAALLAATFATSGAALAATANSDAGAKIIAPLRVENTQRLYFGTIAPSVTQASTVSLSAAGVRNCGTATCLGEDFTPAAFRVTGETDYNYSIEVPAGVVTIANGSGVQMEISNFAASKDAGTLAGGEDSFTVGGDLAVAQNQAGGVYTGSFAVTVEYQ